MDKQNIRFYILLRSKQGIKGSQIHRELCNTLTEEKAPSYPQVCRWVSRFKEGDEKLCNQEGQGRPVEVYTEENIEEVKSLIENDPHITYQMIQKITQISTGTIFKIIHEALQLKKITARYVPHYLSESNKQNRIDTCKKNLNIFKYGSGRLSDILTCDETWIYHKQQGLKAENAQWIKKGDNPPTIIRNKHGKKNLVTIFFNSQGVVHVILIENGSTMNNEIYLDVLKNAFNGIKQKRGLKGLLLPHDNAQPHKHSNIKNYLDKQDVKEVKHLPYSPDLSPCYFWINDYIKRRLDDYENEDQLLDAVLQICDEIPVAEYKKTFQKWLDRLQLCIDYQGEYFEHLNKI